MRWKEDVKFAVKLLIALAIVVSIMGYFLWGEGFFIEILKRICLAGFSP